MSDVTIFDFTMLDLHRHIEDQKIEDYETRRL
jgi:hypothetical protein